MGWHVWGDWGTTRLRLYRVEGGAIVDRLDGPGIGALAGPPGETLLHLLKNWNSHGRPDHVNLCGMAGARNGVREAPYVPCPAQAGGWAAEALSCDLDGLTLRIAPGVRQGERDVMRGEETQIFGALARDGNLLRGRSLFILPGTHSKWVWVEDGVIRGFRTFLTGELFALLAEQSSLVKAKAAPGSEEEERTGWDEGFEAARVGDGMLGSLFAARAGQLLRGRSLGWARGYLSGLLIGTEVEEARRDAALPASVVLIGAPSLADIYERALAPHGVAVRRADGDACVQSGLELLDG